MFVSIGYKHFFQIDALWGLPNSIYIYQTKERKKSCDFRAYKTANKTCMVRKKKLTKTKKKNQNKKNKTQEAEKESEG